LVLYLAERNKNVCSILKMVWIILRALRFLNAAVDSSF
jgi:hypothetical protein